MSEIQQASIAQEKWYHGLLPREDIRTMLKSPGDYLVRSTEPVKGQKRQFVLSAVADGESTPTHFVLQEANGKIYVESRGFENIAALIAHHQTEPLTTKDKHTVLLKTPVMRQSWELSHEDVKLTKRLGEGAFGEVWKGELKQADGKEVLVAVKTAKLESLNKEQIKEIMHEARLMRNLDHPNVVKFYGVGAGQEPLYVIMELADGGALDSALAKNKFPMSRKMELIHQAACGVAYIHEKNLLHRDIAARNCLYGGGQVKISDFGLSREGKEYKMELTKKVPIRWIPPETIKTGLYTQKVDVYAFGIMAWEITEDGKEPYPNMKVIEVVNQVLNGYRMKFDVIVDKKFGDFITNKCWSEKPSERLSMAEVRDQIGKKFLNKGDKKATTIVKSIYTKVGAKSIMGSVKLAVNNSSFKKLKDSSVKK